MAKIELTPAELLSQGAEMAALKSQYESLFQDVTGILMDINSNWSPNLANNFQGKITAAQGSFGRIADMLQLGVDAANTSAKTLQSADSQLAKLMQADAGLKAGSTAAVGAAAIAAGGAGIALGMVAKGTGSAAAMAAQGAEGKKGIAQGAAGRKKKAQGIWGAVASNLKENWNYMQKMSKGYKDWFKSDSGKTIDSALESMLGDWYKEGKRYIDITADIVAGDVSIETLGIGLKAVGLDHVKMDAIVNTANKVTDPDGYYQTRSRELEKKIIDHIQEGDIAGASFLLVGEFTDTVGKGVLDIGGSLIEDALHLDDANVIVREIAKSQFGIDLDIGQSVSDFNDQIGDAFSDVIDRGGEMAGEAAGRVVKHVGNIVSGVSDFVGKLFG